MIGPSLLNVPLNPKYFVSPPCWYSVRETHETPKHAFFLGVGGVFAKLRKATISFVVSLSVRLHGTTGLPLDRFSLFFIFGYFYKIRSGKFKSHWNLTRITGTLHEDRYIFMIISRPFLLGMRNVSDKSCRENQNTHFVFSNISSKIVRFIR